MSEKELMAVLTGAVKQEAKNQYNGAEADMKRVQTWHMSIR